MAYLKPPWFVRKIFNRIAMATGVGNSQTLTVIKRVSKEPQKIPVVVPEVGGLPQSPDDASHRREIVNNQKTHLWISHELLRFESCTLGYWMKTA